MAIPQLDLAEERREALSSPEKKKEPITEVAFPRKNRDFIKIREGVEFKRETPEPEPDVVDVQMRDGFIVRGVPPTATRRQVFDVYNKANGFSTIEGYNPGFIKKTGDFMQDFANGLKAQAGDFRAVKIQRGMFENDTMLAPSYDSNGAFQGFKELSKKETAEQRKEDHRLYIESLQVDEDSAAFVASGIFGEVIDPVNIGALFVGGGLGTAERFFKVLRAETVLGSTESAAEQKIQGEQIDPTKAAVDGVIQGAQLAAVDGVFGKGVQWYRAARATHNQPQKVLNRAINDLEDQITIARNQGLDRVPAIKRGLQKSGLTSPQVRAATKELNRKVDLEGKVLKQLPNRIRKAVGTDKLKIPDVFEKFVTPFSSVTKDMSEAIHGAVRKYDFGVAQREGTGHGFAEAFLKRGSKIIGKGLKGDVKLLDGRVLKAEDHLKGLVLNSDRSGVVRLAADLNDKTLVPAYDRIQTQLNNIGDDLLKRGLIAQKTELFWPRIVKDVDGLMKELGREKADAVRSAIRSAEGKNGGVLNETELSNVVNRFILGQERSISPGRKITKARTLDVIPSRLLPFYDGVDNSLIKYIDDSSKMIEKFDLFGGFAGSKASTTQDSVKLLIAREIKAGRMLPSENTFNVLNDLLTSRFVKSAKGPGPLVQDLRNLFYIDTLGQFRNSATQIADIGLSAYMNGTGNVIKALAKGNQKLIPEQFNLTRKIGVEFADTRATARVLNKTLKWEGFKYIDRMGKVSNLNASILKAESQVKTTKGLIDFRKEWSGTFGRELEPLIADLQAGNITQNVKLLAFNRLADVQPVSLSEMPQVYLNAENGRILFALNSFTIKQIDLVRRRAIREMLTGDFNKGSLNLIRFSALFGAANMGAAQVKDLMLGRESNVEDQFLDAMYKNWGVSPYLAEQVGGGRGFESAMGAMTPFMPWFYGRTSDVAEILGTIPQWSKTLKTFHDKTKGEFPVAGQMYHNWFGGGLEEWREKQDKEELKKLDEIDEGSEVPGDEDFQ